VPLVVHRQLLSLLTGVHKIIELPQIHVLMRVIKAARLSFTSLSIVILAEHMISQKLLQNVSVYFFHALASSWQHKG